jgi:hypothetical protein
VAFLEEQVSHLVIVPVHDEALDLPDLTVGRMNALMANQVGFTRRDGVVDDRLRQGAHSHADPHAGVESDVAHHFDFLGGS